MGENIGNGHRADYSGTGNALSRRLPAIGAGPSAVDGGCGGTTGRCTGTQTYRGNRASERSRMATRGEGPCPEERERDREKRDAYGTYGSHRRGRADRERVGKREKSERVRADGGRRGLGGAYGSYPKAARGHRARESQRIAADAGRRRTAVIPAPRLLAPRGSPNAQRPREGNMKRK
jgi:hypothetical protein